MARHRFSIACRVLELCLHFIDLALNIIKYIFDKLKVMHYYRDKLIGGGGLR